MIQKRQNFNETAVTSAATPTFHSPVRRLRKSANPGRLAKVLTRLSQPMKTSGWAGCGRVRQTEPDVSDSLGGCEQTSVDQ